MSDQHPAEKAFDEVMDEMAGECNTFGEVREAVARVRDRWIEADGRPDTCDTPDVSVPNEYVDDSTL